MEGIIMYDPAARFRALNDDEWRCEICLSINSITDDMCSCEATVLDYEVEAAVASNEDQAYESQYMAEDSVETKARFLITDRSLEYMLVITYGKDMDYTLPLLNMNEETFLPADVYDTFEMIIDGTALNYSTLDKYCSEDEEQITVPLLISEWNGRFSLDLLAEHGVVDFDLVNIDKVISGDVTCVPLASSTISIINHCSDAIRSRR